MGKRSAETPTGPAHSRLDGALGAATAFGQAFMAFCFCVGAFFYLDGRPVASAGYLAIGLLLTPWAARWIERRWPEAARRRVREVTIAVLITFTAFFLGR